MNVGSLRTSTIGHGRPPGTCDVIVSWLLAKYCCNLDAEFDDTSCSMPLDIRAGKMQKFYISLSVIQSPLRNETQEKHDTQQCYSTYD